MRYLNSLLSLFKESLTCKRHKDNGNFVASDGVVARFSFEKRDFFPDGKPKPRIFSQDTHPDTGRLETSVCGLNGVTYERVWFLANTVRSPKTAFAAVEIKVSAITQLDLQCESAPEKDFDEHGVIIGWSEHKDARLAKSQELIAKVHDVKRP